MRDKIVKAIEDQAKQNGCRVLAAVESGSRAWGFASPDSDYDIRAIYTKPMKWYLGLDDHRPDTWRIMLPDDLDVVAWDVRKLMQHILKSNAAILEWLNSPIVYCDDGFLSEMRLLAKRAFNPLHVAYHYASMFRKAMSDKTDDGAISIKKLCYALRANSCVRWIEQHETIPPTEFIKAIDGIELSDATRKRVDDVLMQKAETNEKTRIVPGAALQELLADHYDELSAYPWKKRYEQDDGVRDDLETILYRRVVGD